MLASQENNDISLGPRLQSISTTVNVNSALHSAAAGYVAGVTGVVFGHPLDSAKVWLQTNTAGNNRHFVTSIASTTSPSPSSSSSTFRNASVGLKRPIPPTAVGATASMSTFLTRDVPTQPKRVWNTVRALYSGVTGPLIAVGIVQSINFATYDAMRRTLHQRDHPNASGRDYLQNDSLTNVAVAGFVAGTGLAFITSPLVRIKTRQQITGNGFRQALRETLYPTGRLQLSGCFVGFYPHLISETVGRSLYYAVYEGCKRSVANYKQQQSGIDAPVTISLQERMMSAGLAGIMCWAVIFPMDSLRSRMYHQEGPQQLSTTDMMRVMHKEKAFYRGFTLTILRAGPIAAAVLPIYDLVLEKLSS